MGYYAQDASNLARLSLELLREADKIEQFSNLQGMMLSAASALQGASTLLHMIACETGELDKEEG